MEITYIGHSSFRIKTRLASIITDPFNPQMVGLKYPKLSADLVTISHNHEDHNKAEFIKDTKMIINEPGEYEIMGISIIGIQTFHDDKKGQDRGDNTIFIFEADGVRIAHMGDLGHKLSEELVEEIGTLDILMLPVGGIYTINPQQASETVRAIEPAHVIPMHYKVQGIKEDMFGGLSGVEEFLKEVGLPVEETDKFVFKKDNLVEGENKVIVLRPKI